MKVDVVFVETPEPQLEIGDVLIMQHIHHRYPAVFLWIVGQPFKAVHAIDMEKNSFYYYDGIESRKAAQTSEELLNRLKSVKNEETFQIIKAKDVYLQLHNVIKQ